MKRLVACVAVFLVVSCAGNKAPNGTPTPDPILKAATEAGGVVSAVQGAEIAFYASGSSHISAADQATVQKVFADTSQAILTALNTYSAAKNATTQQAVVSAIVTGVNAIVAQFAKMSDAQMKYYTSWVQTAISLIDLIVPGAAGGSLVPQLAPLSLP